MIAKLKAAYARFVATKGGKLVQRVVVAGVTGFAVAFVGAAVSADLFHVPQILNLSLWERTLAGAASAGLAAVAAAVQSIITNLVTGQPQLTARARRAAVREAVNG